MAARRMKIFGRNGICQTRCRFRRGHSLMHVNAGKRDCLKITRHNEKGLAMAGNVLKRKSWSPYAAGIVIGLLQIPAFLLIDTALGASSAYVTIGALISGIWDTELSGNQYLLKHVVATGKNWWQVALVAGIALGAFLSMRLSGAKRKAISPIWAQALGTARPGVRYAVAFGAGFLMLFGARIADGCTSGHGLSGVAQLSVGSSVAVAAMFAGGIATALLVLRRI